MGTTRRPPTALAPSVAAMAAAAMLLVPIAAGAQVFVVDRYLTPDAGAANLIALQKIVAAVEDRFLPLKLGNEQHRLPLLAGIAYRTAKFIALDVPQDHMLLVAGHEVFGHGARLRELGRGRIGYGFDAPIPYGEGGGVTRFDGDVPDSPLSFLAIEESGVEAQHVLADAIADRALVHGRFHYREAWLYFESRYIALTYILDATEHAREGNDIADFARTFQKACTPPACTPITLKNIQHDAKLILFDPLLYYGVYGFASAYIGSGQATSPIPMIPIRRDLRVLPSLGYQMTPYGTEWRIRTSLVSGLKADSSQPTAQGSRLTTVTLRVGETGATRPWGLDVRTTGIRIPRTKWRVDPAVSVWRQPFILADRTSDPLGTGAAATATFVLPLPRRFTHTFIDGIHVIAGAKSEGFVPGEQLSGGGILRAGLAFRLK